MGTLRTFLALMVVAGHTWGYSGDLELGLIAVSVFFGISGYLMPLTIERNYSSASRFLVNRALRIYPLYWVALTMWLVELLAIGRQEFSAYDVMSNYVLLGVNEFHFLGLPRIVLGPAWTLNLELQFYALLPLLVLALRKRSWHYIIGFTALACLVISLLGDTWSMISGRRLVPWFLCFYVGMATYLYKLERFSPLALIAVPFVVPNVAVGLILAAVAALCLGRQKDGVWGKLDAYIGEYSYPLYILHYPLIYPLLSVLGKSTPYPVLFAANVIACIAASALALHFFTMPIDRVRSKIQRGLTPTVAPQPSLKG